MTRRPDKKPEKKRKATKLVACKRTEQLVAIRLDGAEFWDVRDFVREAEKQADSPWFLEDGRSPMSDTQIWRYMQKADALISASHERNRSKLLRKHLAQRRRLYARAIQAGDIRTALSVLRDEALMIGLYPDADAAAMKEIGKLKDELNEAIAQEGTGWPEGAACPDQDSAEHGPLSQ